MRPIRRSAGSRCFDFERVVLALPVTKPDQTVSYRTRTRSPTRITPSSRMSGRRPPRWTSGLNTSREA